MVDLERNMIPKLLTHMTKGQRYVDETTAYIEPVSINYVPSNLNFSPKKYQFTSEEEKDSKISFLDVFVLRNRSSIMMLFTLGFTFTNQLESRNVEDTFVKSFCGIAFGHLRNVFHHTNVYPKALIQNVISKVKEEQS